TIGHIVGLTQHQFGLWAAIAIHDTSSVVGAAATYGQEALEVTTVVKLARALWIIPVALMSMFVFNSNKIKIKIPCFIVFFLLSLFIICEVSFYASFSLPMVASARSMLFMSLILI